MSTVCLLVPSFVLACALAERPSLVGRPVAVANTLGTRVEDCSPEAARYGVRPGIPLRAAAALCPPLMVVEQRPAHIARVADSLVEALATISPVVEACAPGEVYADLRGLDGLYPRPGMVEAAILAAAPDILRAHVGIAARKFTAHTAARCAAPGTALRIEAGDAVAFLDGKPAAWLPLSTDAVERLRLLGIETVGAFAALPRQAVEAQFGVAGGRAWLAAWDEDPTALRPQPFARERVVENAAAQPPLISRQAVVLTVEQLLGRALRHPRVVGQFVRVLRLRATTEQGGLWERTHVMREPTGDRTRLWTAVQALLEYAEFPGLIAGLELELGGLTAEGGRQRSLFDAERTRRREQLDEMVRHLKVRYGCSPLARVVEVEPWSRIPERRRALMDYDP